MFKTNGEGGKDGQVSNRRYRGVQIRRNSKHWTHANSQFHVRTRSALVLVPYAAMEGHAQLGIL